MDPHPANQPQGGDLHTDVHAAIAARRELGPEMEDHVVEAFVARLEQRVTESRGVTRVKSGVHEVERPAGGGGGGGGGRRGHRSPAEVVAPSLALSIPLVAITGHAAGAWGVFFTMAAVMVINLLYFIDRWVMKD